MPSPENLAVHNAVAAERGRIFTILEHPEARDRHASALALARIPGMSAEQAGAVLASLPKQTALAADSQFARYLAELGVTKSDLDEASFTERSD